MVWHQAILILRHTLCRRHQPTACAFVIVSSTDPPSPTNTADDNGIVPFWHVAVSRLWNSLRHDVTSLCVFGSRLKALSVSAFVSHLLDCSSYIVVQQFYETLGHFK